MHSYRGEANFKTWLYRIASNHCNDYVRSAHYRYTVLTEKIAKFTKGKEPSPEEAAILNSRKKELSEQVLSLPIKYREVIFLFYFELLSQKEISLMLDINLNTVKSRLSRAKFLLKNILEGGDEDAR
ncbi:sigma-70 family RNA polymerase sigma factor [Pseudalkalibacillus sp. A8]|uniref:sigma-70 family RNA polymerase sigma factor n=1 Tax=Pseudalkalibacillus sp. A8 TaxID=3382641 RepID=UPI0038B57E0E